MPSSSIRVSLPDGRYVDVEEINGPENFKIFLEAFVKGKQLEPAVKQNKRFLFFTPKQNAEAASLPAYAQYLNGNHIAVYKVEQSSTGITVSHCDPISQRTITPEIRALLEAYQIKEIVDVGRQKGLYFDQDQSLVRRELGETDAAFKERVIVEALQQINMLQKQNLPGKELRSSNL